MAKEQVAEVVEEAVVEQTGAEPGTDAGEKEVIHKSEADRSISKAFDRGYQKAREEFDKARKEEEERRLEEEGKYQELHKKTQEELSRLKAEVQQKEFILGVRTAFEETGLSSFVDECLGFRNARTIEDMKSIAEKLSERFKTAVDEKVAATVQDRLKGPSLPRSSGRGSPVNSIKDFRNDKEKLEYIKEHGAEKYGELVMSSLRVPGQE